MNRILEERDEEKRIRRQNSRKIYGGESEIVTRVGSRGIANRIFSVRVSAPAAEVEGAAWRRERERESK